MSESDRINVYLAVFKHASLDVDWKAFTAEQGISTTGNAQRKFKECLKKDGFQMLNGKIGPIGEVLETPKKPRQTKEPKSSAKKRKVKQVEEEDLDEADPANEDAEESG